MMENISNKEETKFTTKSYHKTFTNAVFLLSMVIIIVIGSISTLRFYNLIDSNRWVRHTYEVINVIENALYQITYLETRQRGYLLFGDDEYPSMVNAMQTEIQKLAKQLTTLTPDNPSQQNKNNKLSELILLRADMINKMVEVKLKNKADPKTALDLFNKGQLLSDDIKALANEIMAVELSLLKERNTHAIENAFLINVIFVFGQALSVIFLLAAFILFNRELTKRKQAETNRQNIENQLRSIIGGANDMIAAVDKDYRYIIFNNTYAEEVKRIFNRQISSGMNLDEAFANDPVAKNTVIKTWKESLEGDEYRKNIEIDIGGQKNVYEVSSSLIKDAKNEIVGAVHINRNITDKINNQNALSQGMHELRDKNEKITLLLEMSDIMLACKSIHELGEIISKYCGKVLGFSSGIFYIMHPSKNFLEAGAEWGNPLSINKDFSQDQCWALRLGHIHHAGLSQTELTCEHVNVTIHENMTYLCVPLRAQNDIYGLLYVEVSKKGVGQDLSSNERLLVNAFAELAALALANVRLRENLSYQSIRDPLTTLYNRRYLEEFLLKQIHQSERTKTSIAILMIDVDHFKMVNDVNGHDAGDLVLKELSQNLLKEIRPGDLAARYGGEEFIIVLYSTDADTAFERAEIIRKDISLLHVKFGAQDTGGITISIGVAVYPQDGKTSQDLIEAADKALYEAKNSGRNKVVAYSTIKTEA